jgi:hypothetical protein
MTSAEYAANRAAAVTLIRSQQGLANTAPADWTYEQRVAYNKALATYIATNPALFTAQDADTAAAVTVAAYAPLSDNSILGDVATFGSAFGDEVLKAGDKVADVGRGALDAVSFVGKLLPIAAVFVFAVWVLKLKNDMK